MRSIPPLRPDDRTVKAQIRDAAIELIAAEGLGALTARAVSVRAGVSPGSVINNFGSMAGLRQACDESVAHTIRDVKLRAMTAGPSLDVFEVLRTTDVGPVLGYLAAVLVADSAALARLVDELVDDAAAYLEAGVEAGIIRPTSDPRARAVVLTVTRLGALVLHEHIHRLMGVDLTAADIDAAALARYMAPSYEIYTDGLFTAEFGERAHTDLADFRTGAADRDQSPTHRAPRVDQEESDD